MKVKLTLAQFSEFYDGTVPLYDGVLSGELSGIYLARVEVSAADFAPFIAARAAEGRLINLQVSPQYVVVDTVGNVTKLFLAPQPPPGGSPVTPQVLFVISGAYALSTLTALLPAQAFVQATDLVDD